VAAGLVVQQSKALGLLPRASPSVKLPAELRQRWIDSGLHYVMAIGGERRNH
jgi:hypothetical protein